MTIRDIYLKVCPAVKLPSLQCQLTSNQSYLAVMLLILIYALGNKPRHAEYIYLIFVSLLAIHMFIALQVL